MGTFRQRIEIAATPDGPFEALDALVDSGATYAWVPASLLERLGVEPIDTETFIMADGSHVQRHVGEITVRLDGRTRTTMVIFGDEGYSPSLGAVALEELGLGVDPVSAHLVRVPGYLASPRLRERP